MGERAVEAASRPRPSRNVRQETEASPELGTDDAGASEDGEEEEEEDEEG